MSPILFILFVQDKSESFNNDNLTENDNEYLSIGILMLADDMVLIATDEKKFTNPA